MMEQAEHMRALVSDLLTLYALESTPGNEHVPVAVGSVLQQAIQQGQALSQGRHHFHIEIDDRLNVMGAETELSSAFSNLINNAVRYTPKGGNITIYLQLTAAGVAILLMRDSGIGISSVSILLLT